MSDQPQRSIGQTLGLFVILPLGFYSFFFLLLTWPLITSFSTHFFCDAGDGLQNVWNIWWIDKAITQIGQSPWETTLLHYPHGTSLLGHTLNPFNGFMCIPLLRFLSLTQSHNVMIVFSFVVGGWMTFLLCYHLSRSIPASLIGGYIFTFSSYHFAHASGHMQLVSLQWMPLFILLWLRMLEVPDWKRGLLAAGALYLVMLCDYYYFFYCVIIGAVLYLAKAYEARDAFLLVRKGQWPGYVCFIAISLATCGVMGIRLVWLNHREPFWGVHEAWFYSMDVFAPFIPSAFWRFGELTEFFWSRIRGNIFENSVYLGWSVLIILIAYYRTPGGRKIPGAGTWYLLLILFSILAIGPRLTIWGWELKNVPMPYSVATRVFPPLQMSGAPLRMMCGAQLAVAVLFAIGWAHLRVTPGRVQKLVYLVLPLLFVEYLPRPMTTTSIPTPDYVEWIEKLPEASDDGPPNIILDLANNPSYVLYYQTIHEKPMALGYIARYPASVHEKVLKAREVIKAENYAGLGELYGVRYLVMKSEIDVAETTPGATVAFESNDEPVKVWGLGPRLMPAN